MKKFEKEVWDKFNEYFPDGELPRDEQSTLRSKALVILCMAKEMGVRGHAEVTRFKKCQCQIVNGQKIQGNNCSQFHGKVTK